MAEYNFEKTEREIGDIIDEMHPTELYYSGGTDLKDAYISERLADSQKFKNPDPEGPEYVKHWGMNKPGDLLNYIKELEDELKEAKETLMNTTLLDDIKELKDKIKEKEEVLTTEELRELDPSYKALKKELEELEKASAKLQEKMSELKPKITELKETAKQWVIDRNEIRAEAYHNVFAQIEKNQKLLEEAQKEYQKVMKKYYTEPITKEIEWAKKDLEYNINFYKQEIERLKAQLPRELKNYKPQTNSNGNSNDKVTIKFNTNGVVENTALYKTIQIDKGELVTAPQDPILINSEGMNQTIIFDKWMLNGQPFDFTKPVTEDITLDATYKKLDLHPVTFYDEKGNYKFTKRVKHGDILSNPKRLEDKKTKIFDKWILENGEEFDFTQPITSPVVVYAKYKRDWKKIAAIGAGVAVGAGTLGADMLLGTGGLISSVVPVGLGLSSLATDYKLKNNKPKIETQNLKGVKKAGANVVNFFRDNRNLKNITTFLRTATISTLVTGIGMRVSDALQTAAIPEPEPLVDAGISR